MHGQPHALALEQEPQGFWTKRPFQVQPIVKVLDRGQNLANSSSLAIKVELITSSKEITLFNDVLQLNAVHGVARFQNLPCGKCVGLERSGIAIAMQGYSLRLEFTTVLGVASVTSRLFDVGSWPPGSMALSNYPLAAVAGLDFEKQPLITLLDLEGITATWHPDEKMYITVTLSTARDLTPKNLQGTTRVEVVRGKAQFTDLRHDYMATQYNLKFALVALTVSTVKDIQSPLFNVAGGAAFQLSLGSSYGYPSANGTQPSGAVVGFPLKTQPVVLVLDSVRNVLWERALNVTVQLFTVDNESVVDHGFLFNSTRTVISCPLSSVTGRPDCSKCKPTKTLPATCGTAFFTDLRVDRGYENLVLRFSSPGLKSVDSKPLQVPVGKVYALFIEQQPLGFKYNTPLTVEPVVSLKDIGNNTVRYDTDASVGQDATAKQYYVRSHVCMQNNTNPQIECDSSTARLAKVVTGLARFTDISIASVGTNLSIRFCSYPEGLRCAQSAVFEVTEDPTQLLMLSQPGRGIPGLNIGQTPVVRISDTYLSTITWQPNYGLKVNCTLCALSSKVNATEEEWTCAPDERWLELNALSACHYRTPDPLQQLLKGTSSQQVVEGLASFSDLRIDKRGTYKFRFTAGGLIPIDSNPFVVGLGEASRLAILVESAGVHPGLPFETQPTVAVVDDGNNVVETDHGTRINATLWTLSGKDYRGLVFTHFVAPRHSPGYHNATQLTRFGAAIFEGLRIDKVGTYFIRYSTEAYPSIDSSPIQVSLGVGVKLNIIVRPTGCCARASCNFIATQEATCRTVPAIGIVDLGGNLVPWNGVRINATIFKRRDAEGETGLQSVFATSDDRGIATFTSFGVDEPGNYTIKFRNISPYVWRTRHPDGSWTNTDYWVFSPAEANFSVSGRLARLFLEMNPSSIIPGAPMLIQPRLILMDAGGYVVDHDWSTSVTASVKQEIGDSIMLGGQKSQRATPTNVTNTSDQGGRVHFTNLRIDLAAKCVSMHFSAPISTGGSVMVKSLLFNVDVGRYHKITVIQQPGSALIGEPFGIQPHVALTDYGGNIVTDDSKTVITASVFRGTVGDIRSDSKPTKQTLQLIQGQAQFVDLYTKIASACLQLEFLAVGRQPGFSDPFTIMPGTPFRVEFLDDEARDRPPIRYGPAGPRPGLPLKVQPMLKVEDAHGNRIGTTGGIVGGVTASLLEGGGPAQCSYPIKHCLKGTTYAVFNQFDGIVRFTNLQIDRANMFGSYSILFESNDLQLNPPTEARNHTKIYYSLLPVESNREMIVTAGTQTVKLEVVVEPDKFIPGLPMKVTPVIGVVDAGGNVVQSAMPQTISCSIRAENFWWLDLIGEKLILAFNGRETFKDLGINTTARNVTLTFDNLFLGKVDSFSFDVSGPLARLSLLSQSTLSTAGELFPIDAVLRGFDNENMIVTTFGHPPFPFDTPDVITVAINESASCQVLPINETTIVEGVFAFNVTSNQTIDNRVNMTVNTTTVCFEDLRLKGTNTSTYSYGLAKFTDLRIDQAGTYYLRFAVPVLNISIVSGPIVIVNARASELRLITQIQGPKEATHPVKQAPEAMLMDRFGNRVLDKDFGVLATFFQGLAEVPAKYVQGIIAVNTSRGVASFNNSALGLTLAGKDFSIRLSVAGLPPILTSPFEVPVGVPYRLRSLSSPSRFFEKEPFSDEPSFELLDRGGNLIESKDNVTISLWDMQGCENCSNVTNTTNNITMMQTRCTNSQEVFERVYDSNKLPCGQRVGGLHIFQPFCMAEYMNDTTISFCKDVLEGEDTSGKINRHIKEGNFPIKWSFITPLDMSIEAYLYNSSYNLTLLNSTTLSIVNATSNAAYQKNLTTSRVVLMPYNATTLFKLQLKYRIELVSNGSVVRSFCTSEVHGLQPRLYNQTAWGPVDKQTLQQLLERSNMTVANLTTKVGAIGLTWVGLGSSIPSHGTEISNEALAAALGEKTEFTPAEVAKFGLPALSRDSYIRAVNDKYFSPAAADLPQISVHDCIKYNFTRNLDAGKGYFRRVTLASPSNGTGNLKLRITFKDREYIPSYSVSTLHVGPGYRLYRQDLREIPPPIPTSSPSTTPPPLTTPVHRANQSTNATDATNTSGSAMTAPGSSSLNLVDFSKYHIIIESKSFQVSGPPIALRHLTLPLGTATGGTPFTVQPTFQIVDGGGRLVTKVFEIVVTATLITDSAGRGTQVCNEAKPFQCPAPTNVCARDETYCPKLRGQAQATAKVGFVAFTDLAISTCNDPKVPYDLCVNGNYRVQFTAVSWSQSLQDVGGVMTPPANVSLQSVVSDVINNFIGPPAVMYMGIEPIGGSRAGDRLTGQPTVVTKDAGGNRIITSPVKLTAVLSVFNESVPLEDYSQDGIKGTRSVTASFDGSFKWTDLVIDKSSDKFVLNIVQFEAVPGFPRAPTITSTGLLSIDAGYGVKLKIVIQPDGGIGGEPFLNQPTVVVLDKNENTVGVEVYNVSVRLTDESLPIGGLLSKAKILDSQPIPDQSASRFIATTVAGVAKFEGLVIDKTATCYQLVFSAKGLLDAVSKRFDIVSGKIRRIVIIKQPAGAVPGQVLQTQPLIHLTDWGRNPVRDLRDRVEVILVPGNLTANNTEPLKIYGSSLLQATDGIIEFTDLLIRHAGTGFKLSFVRYVGGMNPAESIPLDLAVGVPYRLQVNIQPSGAVSGKFLQIQPQVQVVDAGGNRVEMGSHDISANLFRAGLPSSAALRGPQCTAYECAGQADGNSTESIRAVCPTCLVTNTSASRDTVTTVASVKGISQFTGLAIGKVGKHYTIRFTSFLLLGAESQPPMSVSVGIPVRLDFEQMPSGYLADTPFRFQPIIKLVDFGGNFISDRSGLVTVTLEHAQGSSLLPVGNTRVTMIRGRAIFVHLKVDKGGLGFSMLFTGDMCTHTTGAKDVQCLPARSLPFNVTGLRTHVENKVQVETSTVYTPLQPQPQVHLLDAENRTVDWDSGKGHIKTFVILIL